MPNLRYLIDTNVASYLMRGASPSLAAQLMSVPPETLSVSTITQGELLYGLARKPQATALQLAVRQFLARVAVLPWDHSAAMHYELLRHEMESAGTPLGALDTLIAAHALAAGLILVSNDSAFSKVRQLKFERWH